MFSPDFFSASLLTFFVLMIDSYAARVHVGVDLVTNLSNSIVPTLLRGLSKTNENVVVAPFGLLGNLAMVLEASNGRTRQELLRSLKISDGHVQDLRTGFKAYCELFMDHASEQESVGSFNYAAVGSSFPMAASYKNILTKFYCANVTEGHSLNDTALELRSDAGVVSHWKDYEKLAVYTFLSYQPLVPFVKANSKTVLVPMIPQVGVFKSARWESSWIVLLPLQARFVHLLFIVPDNVDEFDGVISKLVNYNLPNLIESLPEDEMEVFIPQLTAVNKNVNLTAFLLKNDIKLMFDSTKSNLTKAYNETSHVYVKSMIQNSFFSTSFVSLRSVSGVSSNFGLNRRKRDTKRFYLDKPFLFLLLHKDTQLVLLAGKIRNPILVPFKNNMKESS